MSFTDQERRLLKISDAIVDTGDLGPQPTRAAYHRAWRARRALMMTDAERERLRAVWRECARRKKARR